MAKKKASAKKAKAATAYASFQAFGNMTQRVALNSKNRTLGAFLKQNVPPTWNLSTMGLYVNDRPAKNDYFLNDGDKISAAPNVAGGQQIR